MLDVTYFLILGVFLFFIGIFGVLVRKNALIVFMSVELMLNAVNLIFVAFAKTNANIDGQIIALTVIAIAAAEVSFGLALIVLMYKLKKSVHLDMFKDLGDKNAS